MDVYGYHVGEEIICQYKDAPVSPEQQYEIGVVVDIMHKEELLARYRVTATDDTNIHGVVIEVLDD